MARKNAFLTVFIAIVGILLLFVTTDRFQAFTAEQARRVAITEDPPLLEDIKLQDSQGQSAWLSNYQEKYILATYMYTACGDVCPVIERNFLEIYEALPSDLIGEEIQLLSISFDPSRDTPKQLKKAEEVFKADGINWKMVRVPNQQQLDLILDQSGVIVIPTEHGFEHNAAFYLINPEGRLIRIFDYDRPTQVVEQVKNIVGAWNGK